MGCDIHILVEKKHPDGWALYKNLNDVVHDNDGSSHWSLARQRNYHRFARIAGVRGDGPEALGLPSDISRSARLLYEQWESDAHTPSHMPLDIAADIFLETEYENVRDGWSEYMRDDPAETYFGIYSDEADDLGETFRIVFWFDN